MENNEAMHYMDGDFWGMHYFWWIFWILLLVWIFFLPFAPPRNNKKETALEILQKRFARGEITKEEYEEARRTLTSGK